MYQSINQLKKYIDTQDHLNVNHMLNFFPTMRDSNLRGNIPPIFFSVLVENEV